MNSQLITNFGGNQSFRPTSEYAPRDEAELLTVLRECRGRRIRVIGRLHSWSEAPVADDVLINLQHFRSIDIEQRGDKTWVTAGAGCQIKRLLTELRRRADCTLPAHGLISEQTIAGIISTATHGSGQPSSSHFIDELRVATYDDSGEPVIRTIDSGDELRAARCSLGAHGVIVSVGFWARPQHNIEEVFREYAELGEVLAQEATFPRQQFYLIPSRWCFIAQHRRETSEPRGGWATLYRAYCFLNFDIGLHLLVCLVVRLLRSPKLVRFLFRNITTRLVKCNWRVIDDSAKMLIMEHEMFRHIECELFVRSSRLTEAVDFSVLLLKYFDGDAAALERTEIAEIQAMLPDVDVPALAGAYTHHYPICIRRVLPDDTLISMTAGASEPYYAISFISYARVHDRKGFMSFSRVASTLLAAKFDARPHWGKVCPLSPQEFERLYPNLPRFREVCKKFDPLGAFRNKWIDRVLFGDDGAAERSQRSSVSAAPAAEA
jgi:L-gulono-1,4-lactone dehydrogenase